MIKEIPKMETPEWLAFIDKDNINDKFRLEDILRHSLYYPAAGFDGRPVHVLGGYFISFIYVDYSKGQLDLSKELVDRPFNGYEVIARRNVTEKELTPNGWSPELPPPEEYRTFNMFGVANPFAELLILERQIEFGEDHGPHRFSLLYVCAEGAAAYQAIYVSNDRTPDGIAIIRPGDGFGGNPLHFRDTNGFFHRIVLNNPAGTPEFLLTDSEIHENGQPVPCWSEFNKHIPFFQRFGLCLWRSKP